MQQSKNHKLSINNKVKTNKDIINGQKYLLWLTSDVLL